MYTKNFCTVKHVRKQDKVGIPYSSTTEPSLISLAVLMRKLLCYMLLLHTVELREALVLQRVSHLGLMDTRVLFRVKKQALRAIM